MTRLDFALTDRPVPDAPANTPDAQPRGSILIVDDVADNRAILTRRFERRGFEVVEAEGGLEALELLSYRTFDLVLLDVMMPGFDGIETLRRIRATQTSAALPVIMVTAKNQSEDIVQALELGANDYVTKPVDFAVALVRADAQISRKRAEDQMQRARSALQELNENLERRVRERTVGLSEANERLKSEVFRRQESEQKVWYLAHHDALTGLPNRRLFLEQLELAIAETARTGQTLAMVFLDLDGFKSINDSLGHSVGDAVLTAIGARLRDATANGCEIARLGGDEFALVQRSDGQPADVEALTRLAIDDIRRPLLIGEHEVTVGASAGIALSRGGTVTGEVLIQHADLAMYRAKATLRGSYCFFEPEMDARAKERRIMELGLRQALRRSELEVVYQPIVDAVSSRVISFEALLRWRSAELGPVSPAQFIPLAEETGLIAAIGEWVLREACAEAMKWPAEISVAVNVSTVQFTSGSLVPTVVSALASTGLPPHRLELEVTESVMLADSERNLATLKQLHELGVRLSMDDFGTGYSSLSYLRSFRFDNIKIDRVFVQDMSEQSASRAVVRAVAGLGKSFGIRTIAEGVETPQQLAYVREEGCDQVQGYIFSKPIPSNEIQAYLSSESRFHVAESEPDEKA